MIGASWLPCSTLTWQRTIIDISRLHIFIDYRSCPLFRFPHVNYRVLPINKCLIFSNPMHDHCSLILPIVHTNSFTVPIQSQLSQLSLIQKWGISHRVPFPVAKGGLASLDTVAGGDIETTSQDPTDLDGPVAEVSKIGNL